MFRLHYSNAETVQMVREMYAGMSPAEQDALVRFIADYRIDGKKKGCILTLAVVGGAYAYRKHKLNKAKKNQEIEEN